LADDQSTRCRDAANEQPGKERMIDQNAAAMLHAGRLSDAITGAQGALRKAPTDLDSRVFLAELLIFAGNLARADVIIDAATAIDSTTGIVAAEFRQLIRAETARQQLFTDGRVPEFLGEPTEHQRFQLAALVALRAGDVAGATNQVRLGEVARPRAAGHRDAAAFDDFRDADDLLAGSFEVLTTTGKYFWIPTERVVSAVFHPPARPRDLIWRRVSMSVADGPEGDVYMPAIYVAEEPVSDMLKLGRETDWREADAGLVRGVGQRLFLAGDDGVEMMTLQTLRFGA
jgi:type VI secretion system protein ImpE